MPGVRVPAERRPGESPHLPRSARPPSRPGLTFGAPLEFIPADGTPYNHKKQQRVAKKAKAAAVAGRKRAAMAKVRKPVPGVCLTTRTYTAPLNKFMLEEGQWSDDGSMGLCLADSLLAASTRGVVFDGSDLRARFHSWWFHGYCTPFPADGPYRRSVSVHTGPPA